MIEITLKKDVFDNIASIRVVGHAGHSEYGTDIVCAGISTLFQTVVFTLDDRSEDIKISYDVNTPGNGLLVIDNPNRDSYLITSVFEKGAKLLAEQYPQNVTLKVK